MMKVKEINFDMDGTLVNFYGVEGWLEMLHNEDTTPYEICDPLLRFATLARMLNRLQKEGYILRIISWTAMNGSIAYNEAVTRAKKEYLAKHLPSVHWDEICIVDYGTPKHTLGKGILFDDNASVRADWGENAYDECDILEVLKNL